MPQITGEMIHKAFLEARKTRPESDLTPRIRLTPWKRLKPEARHLYLVMAGALNRMLSEEGAASPPP